MSYRRKAGIARIALIMTGAAAVLTACAGNQPLVAGEDAVDKTPAMPPAAAPLTSSVTAAPDLARLPPPAAAAQSDGPLGLDQALALALADNPGLAEIRVRAQALAAIPSQEGTLPDPMLSLNALNLPTDTFALGQEPMTQLQIGISQALPFPGKLGLREAAAGHDAGAAAKDVDEKRLMLIRDVKLIWWNLFYLDRALEILARNQDLLRQFVDIAQTKYQVGQGLQQDVLLAQVELSQLLDQEIGLKGMRRSEEARLNALLNRSAESPIALPQSVAMELYEPAQEDTLWRLAEHNRPLLAARQSRLDAATARLELATKDYYPDFKVGAAYGFRKGNDPVRGERPDFASFLFSMNLPVFTGRKQAKAVDQRHAQRMQQTYALQDSRVQVRKEISTALADYRRAHEQFQLFEKGIIPQARQTVASMLAGYQTDQVDFLNLVRAQVSLYNFETQRWKAFSTAKQSLARLAAASGQAQSAVLGQEKSHE